jgi:hypothetical protein
VVRFDAFGGWQRIKIVEIGFELQTKHAHNLIITVPDRSIFFAATSTPEYFYDS